MLKVLFTVFPSPSSTLIYQGEGVSVILTQRAGLNLNSRDPEHWEALNQHMQELSNLYGALRKVSNPVEDVQKIEKAAQATQEYLSTAAS
jgi:hypothetical protein